MNERLEKIRAQVARIDELNATELDELKAELGSYFDEVFAEETTPETVAIIQELGGAIEATMARTEAIEAATAQAEADKQNALKIRAALDGGPEDDGDGADDDGGDGTPEGEAGKTPELVAAGQRRNFRSSPSRMRRREIRPVNDELPRASLVAAGQLPGKAAGTPFTDRWDLAEAMTRQLQSMHPAQSHGRVVVASADFSDLYPAERRLIKGDLVGNAKKFDSVVGLQALVASGGTCLPVNVDYTLDTWATADRPLKTGFAQFQAERGGLTYRQPPTVAALAGATSIWTEATDADPGEATKPVLSISCEAPITTYVNAVPTRLGFGNLMGQFDPDTIAANTDLAIAAAARVAETELLTLLQAACVANITSAAELGAARDLFFTLDQIVANFRYTHRLPDTQVLTVVLPNWVKKLLSADRVRELAHDNAGSDVLMLPDSYWDDVFGARNVKCIWTLDALPVNGEVYPTQQFSGFASAEPVPEFPTSLVWNIFIEGSVQFLDSGLLNLGVVRDATLDATNDYETFLETFEGLAFRGFSAGALQIVSTLVPCGGSSGSVALCS
jgi:hypothetical protein